MHIPYSIYLDEFRYQDQHLWAYFLGHLWYSFKLLYVEILLYKFKEFFLVIKESTIHNQRKISDPVFGQKTGSEALNLEGSGFLKFY